MTEIERLARENAARASSLRGGAGIWDWDNLSEADQEHYLAEARDELITSHWNTLWAAIQELGAALHPVIECKDAPEWATKLHDALEEAHQRVTEMCLMDEARIGPRPSYGLNAGNFPPVGPEAFSAIDDLPLPRCPKCGGDAMRMNANNLAFIVRCRSCGFQTPLERCEIDADYVWNSLARQEKPHGQQT